MRVGVILASHGEFARAALGSVEMVVGPQDDVRALGLGALTSLEEFEAAFGDAYDRLAATCDLVVVLCDILGGTPFNVVCRAKAQGRPMLAYTGLSLPVLIELLVCRGQHATEQEVAAAIEASASAALSRIEVAPPAALDEEDEL